MDFERWAALVAFMVAGYGTPGPNNMMLVASGVNFGFRRTIPHILGIAVGTFALSISAGYGLHGLLLLYPQALIVIQVLGVLYLLYLAYKIATASSLKRQSVGKPLTLFEATAFQFVNPKALGVAASVVTAFSIVPDFQTNAWLVAVTAGIVNMPCVSVWALFGTGMQRVLKQPHILRVFNIGMAVLLVLTLLPLLSDLAEYFGVSF